MASFSTSRLLLLLLLALSAFVFLAYADADESEESHSEESEEESESEKRYFAIHGWLMWLGFGVFFPIGVIVSRHFKSNSAWFPVHYVSQLIGLGCVVAGFSVGAHHFWEATEEYQHAKLGVAIFVLAVLNPLIALLRPSKDSPARPFWFIMHWLVGMGAVLLGFVNLYSGLELYHHETDVKEVSWLKHLLSGNLAVVAFVYLFLDRWNYIRGESEPSMTKP